MSTPVKLMEVKAFVFVTRWLEPNAQGFRNFLADMGPRPNCRWGTPKEQAIHKTHIMWKNETPPPIPSIRDTNEQIDDIFGH